MVKSKRVKGGNTREVKAMVKQMIASKKELKFFNTSFAVTTSATPAASNISQAIIQGVGGGQRVGDDISIERLIFKMRVDINQNNLLLSNVVRILLVQDYQANGTVPAITEILTGTNVTSLYNEVVVKSNQFKILYDHIGVVSLGGPSGYVVEKTIRMKGKINYTDTTNVSTANGRGALFLFLWADTSVNHPGVNGEIEMRYTDS